MGDELATVLRLVSEGKLSAEEAAPIIAALNKPRAPQPPEPPSDFPFAGATSVKGSGRGRRVRIQVHEGGRKAVDLRVPLGFAAIAARMVPGIPDNYAALIEQAVEGDIVGPIVDVEDEDGASVLISIE